MASVPRFTSANPATLALFGAGSADAFVSFPPWELSPEVQPDGRLSTEKAGEMIATALREGFHSFEWAHRRITGEAFLATVLLARMELDGKRFLQATVRDVTDERRGEAYREMGREILQTLNGPGELPDALRRVLATLKTRTGLDAVAIRLQDGEDFPYFAQDGFSADFLRTENTLLGRAADGGLCRDEHGNARLECTCGLVISGTGNRTSPPFTPGGSFWINDSFPLLDLPPGEDPRHNPRNRCIHGGYASVALVPIRNPDRIVGLLQFNDRRKGCFSLGTVELLEGIAAHIGAALTQRQADDGLRRSERKYRTLFESLAEGVALHEIVKDEAGKAVDYRILDVNPAYQRHTGIDAASAPGRLGSEIYGTLPPPFLVEYDRVANGGEDLAFETWFAPLARHFRISVVSHRQGQFATLFDDITRRRGREEELRQKTAEMERFTRMISHDLKAPLVTVGTFLGFVERDLEEGSLERLGKDLGFIRGATVKMARRLEDLLAISEVGRVVNAPEEVDLADLIRESVKTVAGAIAIAGVEVRIDASPVTLFGDRSQLEQVWQNLVENAVKYMGDQPSPRIDLGVVAQGDQTVFFVRDNGIGIDPRFHGRVFEPFEKLDAASEGTGLGLALVRRIVEIHQGRVWLESEGQGRGSRFLFTLPRALKGGESRG